MTTDQQIINQFNYQLRFISKAGFVPQHFPPEKDDFIKGIEYKDYRIWAEFPNGGMTCISIMSLLGGTWFSFPCGVKEVEPFFDYHESEKAIAWAKEVIDRAIKESEFAQSALEESYE